MSVTRREALKSLVSLPVLQTPPGEPEESFLPEEFWRERMKAPDDGRRYAWFVDTRRCFGCHACEVACKGENDVPLGYFIRQTLYKDVGQFPDVVRYFLPVACQHCEDAPCIKACPCGALRKGEGGTVVIDYDICCGHAKCTEVCPYGAVYLDPVAHQAVKCHNCYHRLEVGMEPACVSTCPSHALHFGDLNDPNSSVSKALQQARDEGLVIQHLRPEKGTKPRVFYVGDAVREAEDRVPREGERYTGDGYNIHHWKGKQE